MGYGTYTVHRRGEEIEAGYNVEDVCNEPGCDAEIDRGLGCLCGEMPGGDEHGCGGYFCGEHLYGGWPESRCKRCMRPEPDDDAPADLLHTVGNFQHWLDRLRLKIPRALCGASLVGEPDEPEPTVPCPACVATDLHEETSMLARITMVLAFLIVGAILVAPMFWHH